MNNFYAKQLGNELYFVTKNIFRQGIHLIIYSDKESTW